MMRKGTRELSQTTILMTIIHVSRAFLVIIITYLPSMTSHSVILYHMVQKEGQKSVISALTFLM